jgi:hypothetical protein
MRHIDFVRALVLVAAASVFAGCGLLCHEWEVGFNAVLPPVTTEGPVVLLNRRALREASGQAWEPVRVEGPEELTLAIRASAPLTIRSCVADPNAPARWDAGPFLVDDDARGETTLVFAECFWLTPADEDHTWTVQVTVTSDLVYIFGEEKTVSPRDVCPYEPGAADFAWLLAPAE